MAHELSAIILDDEQDSVELLSLKIRSCCPQITQLYTSTSPAQALQNIPLLQPDLLFIDIQMPGMDGFSVLEQLAPVRFGVIFITAFDQYAIRALRFNALDYLLKPVDDEELKLAVARAGDRQKPDATQLRASGKIAAGVAPDKFAVPSPQGITFIQLNDILMAEAYNNYSKLLLTDGLSFLLSKAMREVQVILEESHFLRIHRQYIINLNHVRQFNRHDSLLIMNNKAELPVARTMKEKLMMHFRML